jgi:hypothetical protein
MDGIKFISYYSHVPKTVFWEKRSLVCVHDRKVSSPATNFVRKTAAQAAINIGIPHPMPPSNQSFFGARVFFFKTNFDDKQIVLPLRLFF